MIWYLSAVFVHIMCAILWIGYVLFWLIITRPIERRFDSAESSRILGLVNHAEWPPRMIPSPVRLRFSQVAWVFLVVLALTGTVMAVHRGVTGTELLSGAFLHARFGQILTAKLAVVVLVVALQLRLARRPGTGVVLATTFAAVGLVILSTILARTDLP